MPRSPRHPTLALAAFGLFSAAAGAPACVDREDAPARQVADGDLERGRLALERYGCGGCHQIPGVPRAVSWVAPPLMAYAERGFVAGVMANNADNLIAWIMDPPAVDPLTAMPNLGVTREDARDMAAYLYSLRGQ